MLLSALGGMLNSRNTESHPAEYKTTRTQFKPTHQLVKLVTSPALIAITSLLCSRMMFGLNHANVDTTTTRARIVPAIRHLRCWGRVRKPESKVAIANRPTSGVANIQNRPPAFSANWGFAALC